MATEILPWERQEEETMKQYEAFCVYRDMKDPTDPTSRRSIRQVSDELGKSEGLLERWSSKNNWGKRAEAWDEEQEKRIREIQNKEQLEAIKKMRKRHAALGSSMLIKAARALSVIPDDEINATALSRMVEVGSKLERISRGDVGEVVEERDGGQAISPVQFYMPSNGRDQEQATADIPEYDEDDEEENE